MEKTIYEPIFKKKKNPLYAQLKWEQTYVNCGYIS